MPIIPNMRAASDATGIAKLKLAWVGGFLFFLLGSAVLVTVGVSWERKSFVSMTDFRTVYCGARALIKHRDPYIPENLNGIYATETGERSRNSPALRDLVTRYIYLPSAFAVTVPIALLPWGPAHSLWMFLTGSALIFAAFLMWKIGSRHAPVLCGLMLCLFLITSELLIEVGNAAGIAIGLCVIATWCFLEERFVRTGILFLALSLLIKPHDAGFVWLYFVLIGGVYRKRALRALLLTFALALPVVIWVSSIAPHWIGEMQSNITLHSLHGGDSDPGPAGIKAWAHGAQLISLQTVLSVIWDNPRFYNLASYLLCGLLLILWGIVVLRSRPTSANAWLAIASVAALTMLPTYHRQQDTRLLLLTIPAFSIIWAQRGGVRWLALMVTAAGVLFTGDTTLQILGFQANEMGVTADNLLGKILMLLLGRPAPLAILAIGIFFLFVASARNGKGSSGSDDCALAATMHAGPDRCVSDVLESHPDGADSPANLDHNLIATPSTRGWTAL